MDDRTRIDGTAAPVKAMLAVQALAYVVLAALGAMMGLTAMDGPYLVVAVAVMLVAFAVCTPLRDGVAGQVIAGLCGAASLLFAAKTLLGPVVFSSWMTGDAVAGDTGDAAGVAGAALGGTGASAGYAQEAWLAGVGGLLAILIVASFIRQMAREERSHLIRGVSHTVLDGVAMIGAAGWCFLPELFPVWPVAVLAVAVLAVVLIAVALAVASVWWLREADPDARAKTPWVGVALLPVMLAGAPVAVTTLLVALI